VETLRTALDIALQRDCETWTEAELERIGQHGALRNLADADPAFVDLLNDSPVTPLLQRVMAPHWIIQAFDGLVLLPGQGRFPWDYHTDLECLLGVALPRSRACPAVNVLVYLDTVTVENGATWIVPNSHLGAAHDFDRTQLAELSLPAVGEAGDVLVFDARLWHCAGNNRSNAPRRLVKVLYCEPWIRPQMDYVRATRPEVWKNLPGEVKRLLGESAAPPASVAELRARFTAPPP
jgi:ectoine hydroxylase-related dioxygenase (phytanoyl-CoA dioxygenase family)